MIIILNKINIGERMKTGWDKNKFRNIEDSVITWVEENNPTQKLLINYIKNNYDNFYYLMVTRNESRNKLDTNFVRYLKSKDIILRRMTKQERIDSVISYNQKRWGVNYTWQLPSVQLKKNKTNMDRYGNTNPGSFNKESVKIANEKQHGSIKQRLQKFIKKSSIVHKNRYDYSKVIYKSATKPVIITCPVHGDFEQIPYSHSIGHGCLKCYGTVKLTKKEFIEKSRIGHGYKYDYSKVAYKNNTTPVEIICPKHGSFYQIPANHMGAGVYHGCPTCSESKGEQKIRVYLENNNIEFIREYSFDDLINIRRLRFDFYLPKYNILIEYDGEQHFNDNIYIYNEQIILNDLKKNTYAKDNNILLLRIPYTDYDNIDDILHNLIYSTKKEGN